MKRSLLALLLGTAALSHAQKPAPFVLKGTLPKVHGPAQVFMRREGLLHGAITDSATIQNGKFELRGTVAEPTKADLVLVLNGKKRRLRTHQADHNLFYLEQGTTIFTSPDSLTNAQVTGSTLTQQFQELRAQLKPIEARNDARWAQYRAATAEQRQAPAFRQAHEAPGTALANETKAVLTAYIRTHPQTLVSLGALQELGGPVPNYAAVAPLFAGLAPAVKATAEGQTFAKTLQELQRVAIGAQAPDFTLATPDGKTVALSSLRGKYVLVDFWASWCGPCRQENPNVAAVYQAYKDRNFEILGVSIDVERNRAQWLKAIADDKLTWPQVSDLKKENEAARLYSVQAIPQNFLIDPSGKIVATNLRGEQLKNTVARFIP